MDDNLMKALSGINLGPDPRLVRDLAIVGQEQAKARASTNLMAELAQANLASEFYERLLYWMAEFDKGLNQDEEVGIRLVSFGQAITFHVTDLDYHNPSLVIFKGVTTDEQKVTLIQHVTQLSFLLMAMKRKNPEEPKEPFGFHMKKKEEQLPEQP